MIKKIMDETSKGFMHHNGDIELKKIDENNYFFSSIVKEIHLNSGKIAHGGYLATIADTGMGTAAHIVSNKRCVTISLEIKFISAGLLGQVLNGKVKIQKKTKSLVFITCEIFKPEGTVITASGVWKIL
jgi:acyl-coenzyme A thioesterase PaaI-like protein